MVVLLWWLAVALTALLALVLLLLLVPVEVDAAWDEERRSLGVSGPGVRLAYDAGERSAELHLLSRRVRRWTTAPRPRRPRRRRRRPRPQLSLREAWAERGPVLRALGAFFHRLRWRRLLLEAVVATPDPAVTGWLCGAAYSGRAMLPPRLRSGVVVRPDFLGDTPALLLEASIRLRPVDVAVLAVRLWRAARRARRGDGGGRSKAPADDRGR